jgi:hypothetical protein
MGINVDSKASVLSTPHSDDSHNQPGRSTQTKAQEAGGSHRDRNIMASIADDDDRLLARIGYTPVSKSSLVIFKPLKLGAGPPPSFLEMVYGLVCDLYSRCTRLSASNVRRPNGFRWTSNGSMGMVHRQYHGILHSKLRCVVRRNNSILC